MICRTPSIKRIRTAMKLLSAALLHCWLLPFAHAAVVATSTTLTLSQTSVAAGTVVTLTATVQAGGAPVNGTVRFCDASTSLCTDAALLGTRALNSGGVAVLKLPASIAYTAAETGTRHFSAIYTGTSSYASSASTTQDLAVSPVPQATTTALSLSGVQGSYTFTTTVTAFSPYPFLSGNIVLMDTTASQPQGATLIRDTSNGGAPVFGFASTTPAAGGTYPLGAGKHSVIKADLNADGYPDLVVSNDQDQSLTILLGSASGSFTSSTFALAAAPGKLVAADFDGDGIADLTYLSGGSAGILLGVGDGTFHALALQTVSVNPLTDLAVGDFNQDGRADLAFADNSANISLLLGAGAGTMTPASWSFPTVGSLVRTISLLKLFQSPTDAAPGLVIAGTLDGDANFSVLTGNGDGTFTPSILGQGAPDAPVVAIQIGDVNGDGSPDITLVTEDQDAHFFSTWLASPATPGSFTAANEISEDASIGRLVAGNFRGAGFTDFASIGVSSGVQFYALLQPHSQDILLDGSDSDYTPYGQVQPFMAGDAVAGDFNLDGVDDIAVVDTGGNTLRLLMSQPNWSVAQSIGPQPIYSASGQPADQIVAQYTPDNNTFLLSSTSDSVSAGVGQIATQLTVLSAADEIVEGQLLNVTVQLSPAQVGGATATGSIVFLDENGQPLAQASLTGATGQVSAQIPALQVGDHEISVAYTGDASFSPAGSILEVTVNAAAAGDPATQSYTLLTGSGQTGNYTLTATTFAPIPFTGSVTLNPKMLYSSISPASSSTLPLGPASKGYLFTSGAGIGALGTSAMVVADFDHDGILDVASANGADSSVILSRGDGQGHFTPSSIPSDGAGTTSIAAFDFNHDGNLDLVTTNANLDHLASDNYAGPTFSIFTGNGAGGLFPATTHLLGGSTPSKVLPVDVDGDGWTDLVFTDLDGILTLVRNKQGQFGDPESIAFGGSFTSVVAADFTGDGRVDLMVTDAYADAVILFQGNGGGGFTQVASFDTGSYPGTITLGDLNHDGRPDLAITNIAGNSVTILLNQGGGSFTPASGSPFALPAGYGPSTIAESDFDGDGNVDLAVASSYGAQGAILLGDGKGGFHLSTLPPFSGYLRSYSIAAGDVNGDGYPDLILGDIAYGQISVNLLHRGYIAQATTTGYSLPDGGLYNVTASYAGDGTILPSISSPLTLYGTPTPTSTSLQVLTPTPVFPGETVDMQISVSPSTHDGFSLSGYFYIFDNGSYLGATFPNSAGVATFSTSNLGAGSHALTATFYPSAPYPYANFASSTSSAVHVVSDIRVTTTALATTGNAGNAVFSFTATVQGTQIPGPSGTVQFNDTTNGGALLGSVNISKRAAQLGFSAQGTSTVQLGSGASQLVHFDVNNDNVPDLIAVTNGKLQLQLGVGSQGMPLTFQPAVTLSEDASLFAFGDVNGDGFPDIGVVDAAGANVTIFFGDGQGGFTPAAPNSVPSVTKGIALGDFDGDGKADLALSVITQAGNSEVDIYLGSKAGDGTFISGTHSNGYVLPQALAAIDLNGDKKLDLMIGDAGLGTTTLLFGQGDGSFVSGGVLATAPTAGGFEQFLVTDLNGDGNPDIVTSGTTPTVYLGDGAGNYTQFQIFRFNAKSIDVADFDHDSKADLVLAGPSGTQVYTGDGKGNFNASFTLAPSGSTVAALDLNNDSAVDLVLNGTAYLQGQVETLAAVLSNVKLSPGTNSIVASYQGDTLHNRSTSLPVSVSTTGQGNSTLQVASGDPAPVYGRPFLLGATVTPSYGAASLLNGETVYFYDGSTLFGSAKISNGVASLSVSTAIAGSHTFSAAYLGDSHFSGATSTGLPLTVAQGTPVVVWPAPDPIHVGDPLTTTQLNASATSIAGTTVPGTFVYNPPVGSTPAFGYQPLATTFTPADTKNFSNVTAYNQITVKGILTITANDKTRGWNTTVPYDGTITGFLNGDTAAVLKCQPNYLGIASSGFLQLGPGTSDCTIPKNSGYYRATNYYAASADTLAGKYAIKAWGAAADLYDFTYVDGTLAIYGSYTPATSTTPAITAKATQQIYAFTMPSAVPQSNGLIKIAPHASSALEVTCSVSGPAGVTSSGGICTITPTGKGAVTVTVNQAGDATFSAATPVAKTVIFN